MAEEAAPQLDEFTPQGLANFAYAFNGAPSMQYALRDRMLKDIAKASIPRLDDFSSRNLVNLVLLAVVGGLGLFILSFFGEAAVTAADASKELATKLDAQDKAAGRPRAAKPSGPVFDDSANPNDTARMATLTKGTRTTSSIKDKNQKIDFTKSENGFDFAPWMQIDQRAVAKAEAQRRAKKAQPKRK